MAIDKKDQELLRPMLSCLDKMTPAAQQELRNEVAKLYRSQHGADKWLALLSAGGLELLPHMDDVLKSIPTSVWAEVGGLQS